MIEIDDYLTEELHDETEYFIVHLIKHLPELDNDKDKLVDEISKILASYLSKLDWIE
jgi:hypothetical protein